MSIILNTQGQGQGQICQDKKFSKYFDKLFGMVSRWSSDQNISVGCPRDVFFLLNSRIMVVFNILWFDA